MDVTQPGGNTLPQPLFFTVTRHNFTETRPVRGRPRRAAGRDGTYKTTREAAAESQRADGRPNAQRLHRQVPWMDWMGMGMTTRASDGKMPDRPGDYESIAAARCHPSTLALGRSVLASRLLLDRCTPT